MSVTPQPQLRVDGVDLRRRMVWGLIGGRSKADIALAEGLSLVDCQAILEQPGTYLLFNVWSQFLWHQQRGGWKHLLAVVRWAMNCVLYHAKSCAVGEGVGRCMIIAIYFNLRIAGTLRLLVKLLYATAGRSDEPAPRMGHVRRKLVDIMAWGIETGLTEKLLAEVDEAALYALDRRFRAAMARGEISCFDMTPPGEAEIEAARAELDAAWQAHCAGEEHREAPLETQASLVTEAATGPADAAEYMIDETAASADPTPELTPAASPRAPLLALVTSNPDVPPMRSLPPDGTARLRPVAARTRLVSVAPARPPPTSPPVATAVSRREGWRRTLPPLVRPRPIQLAA